MNKDRSRINDFKQVEKIINGGDKELWDFYKIYEKKISSFVKNRISDCKDAEETIQDIFLDCIWALRDYTGKSSLSTYIYAIAKNKVVDYYRKKKLKQILFSQLSRVENLIRALNSPEEELEKNFNKEKIAFVFTRLKSSYQKVIIMKYAQGFSVIEIAGKLNQTIKMVESRIFRARKAFNKLYYIE